MNAKLERLRAWGCDVAGALERMLDDEEFYLDCLQTVAEDPSFAQLIQMLQQQDYQAAFEAAHTLKGVLGNVGLTPMLEQVSEIVEPLRSGGGQGLEEKAAELERMRGQLSQLLAD